MAMGSVCVVAALAPDLALCLLPALRTGPLVPQAPSQSAPTTTAAATGQRRLVVVDMALAFREPVGPPSGSALRVARCVRVDSDLTGAAVSTPRGSSNALARG